MTKGDRDKLRAELAGKAMAAIIGKVPFLATFDNDDGFEELRRRISAGSRLYADSLMAELGISMEDDK